MNVDSVSTETSRLKTLSLCLGPVALGAAACVGFLVSAALMAGEWGIFPLDDSYIHLRLADNWLNGRGFVINPGETAVPESSALWGALLCLGGGVGRLVGVSLPTVAMTLSLGFFLALAPLAWLAIRRLTGDPILAMLGAATLMVTGRLLWAAGSGMEITLAAALGLLVVWLDLRSPDRRFSWVIGITGGLAALARPELAILVAVIAVIRGRNRLGPWLEAALAAAVFSIYSLHLWFHTGSPLPPTLGARMAFFDEPRSAFLINQLKLWAFEDNAALILLVPIGVAATLATRSWNRLGVLWTWPLVHLLAAFAVFHVSHHHSRYLLPLLPAVMVAVVASLPLADEKILRGTVPLARTAAALMIAASLVNAPNWSQIYARNVTNIHDQQFEVARWINETLPADAHIAVNDIGAYTYLTDRRVTDLAGLATPSVLPLWREVRGDTGVTDEVFADVILERECDHAIIFPRWFPRLTRRTDLLGTMRLFHMSDNTICGDDLVQAYRVRTEDEREAAAEAAGR